MTPGGARPPGPTDDGRDPDWLDASAAWLATLPSARGTYVLWLRVDRACQATVGALGVVALSPGLYGYVGSALGGGGLRARLGHHLSPHRRRRWHIDYLTARFAVAAIWLGEHPDRLEHTYASALARGRGIRIGHPRFGSSDCQCETHLFHAVRPPSLAAFRARMPRTAATRTLWSWSPPAMAACSYHQIR